MRRRSRWAAALLMCSTITAQANFLSGNDLHDFCTGSVPFARGYIMGVADLNDLNLGGVDLSGQTFVQRQFICVPQGVTGQQAGDVVCKYLVDHPEERQNPAALLVYKALLAAWRCPQWKSPPP